MTALEAKDQVQPVLGGGLGLAAGRAPWWALAIAAVVVGDSGGGGGASPHRAGGGTGNQSSIRPFVELVAPSSGSNSDKMGVRTRIVIRAIWRASGSRWRRQPSLFSSGASGRWCRREADRAPPVRPVARGRVRREQYRGPHSGRRERIWRPQARAGGASRIGERRVLGLERRRELIGRRNAASDRARGREQDRRARRERIGLRNAEAENRAAPGAASGSCERGAGRERLARAYRCLLRRETDFRRADRRSMYRSAHAPRLSLLFRGASGPSVIELGEQRIRYRICETGGGRREARPSSSWFMLALSRRPSLSLKSAFVAGVPTRGGGGEPGAGAERLACRAGGAGASGFGGGRRRIGRAGGLKRIARCSSEPGSGPSQSGFGRAARPAVADRVFADCGSGPAKPVSGAVARSGSSAYARSVSGCAGRSEPAQARAICVAGGSGGRRPLKAGGGAVLAAGGAVRVRQASSGGGVQARAVRLGQAPCGRRIHVSGRRERPGTRRPHGRSGSGGLIARASGGRPRKLASVIGWRRGRFGGLGCGCRRNLIRRHRPDSGSGGASEYRRCRRSRRLSARRFHWAPADQAGRRRGRDVEFGPAQQAERRRPQGARAVQLAPADSGAGG